MSTPTARSAARTQPGSALPRDLQARFAELVEAAHRILGADLPDGDLAALEMRRAKEMIAQVAATTVAQVRALPAGGRRLRELCDLALRTVEYDGELREHDRRRRQQAIRGVESALERLRYMTTRDDLVESVCAEVVRSCGFSRVMLSRVVDRTWMPWVAHFSHRPIRESDREWMASTRIPMNTMLLERELVEHGRPAYVPDAASDQRTSKAFLTAVGTTSYVAAPIFSGSRVIGFMHADYYPSPRAVDDVDGHILGQLCDGFGRIYERTVLMERLHAERDHVRETLRTAERIMDNLARAEIELVRQADERAAADGASTLALAGDTSAIDELLTPRERDVINLLVTGQTNSAIAERLVISEGTVKSHVKQILRKLGAVNRSEVIARYLGVTEPD